MTKLGRGEKLLASLDISQAKPTMFSSYALRREDGSPAVKKLYSQLIGSSRHLLITLPRLAKEGRGERG